MVCTVDANGPLSLCAVFHIRLGMHQIIRSNLIRNVARSSPIGENRAGNGDLTVGEDGNIDSLGSLVASTKGGVPSLIGELGMSYASDKNVNIQSQNENLISDLTPAINDLQVFSEQIFFLFFDNRNG